MYFGPARTSARQPLSLILLENCREFFPAADEAPVREHAASTQNQLQEERPGLDGQRLWISEKGAKNCKTMLGID